VYSSWNTYPTAHERRPFPKPDNFDAMSAAWNDPVAFAREVAIYDAQLIAAGEKPTTPQTGDGWSGG